MERNYTIKIISSSRDLTPKEKIKFKDVTNMIKLDAVTQELNGESLVIDIAGFVELAIHNEKASDKDYTNFVVIAKNGDCYVTGSSSFINSFMDIYNDMDGEDFSVEVYRKPSKNYVGKDFLTCSIVLD